VRAVHPIKWKAKYGGLEVSELVRAKELEAENRRLERMYAELALEHEAIKGLLKNCSAVGTPGHGRPFGRRGWLVRPACWPGGGSVAGVVLPGNPGAGATRCAGDRGAQRDRRPTRPLGLLEVS
jgi:Transposase